MLSRLSQLGSLAPREFQSQWASCPQGWWTRPIQAPALPARLLVPLGRTPVVRLPRV